MPLNAGSQIGPYEIVGMLGAGGMGEVYRARDPRLNREAAIKVLPQQFSDDGDRLRRFEQEARAAGMLSHPNILTIHDIGRTDGMVYVVSELLEGETLRERLQTGSIPARKAVEYALQIARGLSAAHDKGIAHRDLKPENIFLTRDGRVKILDFGLAKLSDEAVAPVAERSALQTMDQGTQPGIVLGTMGYMAPEQVRGLGADHRSDIFAFGAILYEMLTGNRAFHGKSTADTISAILKEDPPELSAIARDVPPSLEHVIRHCLEKNPEERFQSARDLAFDLEMLSGISSASSQQLPVAMEEKRKIPWKIVVPVLMLAAILLAFLAGRKTAGTAAEKAVASAPLETRFERLTDLQGQEYWPGIAPDGKSFVYVREVKGKLHIFLSRVGGQKPIDLTEDSDVDNTHPTFSPDGQQIAFRSERNGGGIFLMGATGESVKRLSNLGSNPSWSPDGKEVVCATEGVGDPLGRGTTSQLWAFQVSSGEKRLITKGDAVQPSWSPHGQRIAYWGLRGAGGQRDIWTIDAKGKEQPVSVTDDRATDWNPFWSPDGNYLYFVSDRGGTMNLWRVSIDETSGEVRTQPESITTPSVWSDGFSISSNGSIVFSALDQRSLFQKVQFNAEQLIFQGELQTVFTSGDTLAFLRISPDGKFLTYGSWWPQGDISILPSDGSDRRKLTDDPQKDRYPNWTPDGKDIIFMSDRSGRYEFWMIHPDGSGLRKVTETTDSNWRPVFSPDGHYLSSFNGEATVLFDTSKPMPWKNPTVLPPLPDELAFSAAVWSADGKTLIGPAIAPDDSLHKMLVLYSLEQKQYEEIPLPYVPNNDGIVWVNPQRLLILSGDSTHLMMFDTTTKKVTEIQVPSGFKAYELQYSPSEKSLFFVSASLQSDVWLMTLNSHQ